MRYTTLIPLTVILLSGCFSEKKVVKDENNNTTTTTTKRPDNEVYPIKLNNRQKIVYKKVEEYLNRLKSLDVEGTISMTYPKFFTVFNKNTYRSQLMTMTNSSNIDIIDFSAKITQIGKIDKFENGEFTTVEYTSTIKVYLKNSRLYNTPQSINTLYSILVRKYGRENIHVDTTTRVVTIIKQEKLLAIKESSKDWKFIGDNQTYRKVYYPRFLPIEILNRI